MRQRILIIDDEQDQCLLLAMFLTRNNYDVFCAYTLSEGLTKLKADHPDILLLDDNLPDGLGWAQARSIQNDYPLLRITLMSAHETSPFAISGNGFGFTQLEKPISIKTLSSYL